MDLTDAAVHAAGPPHALWRVLRETEPVQWQPVGFWSVTSYPDVARVLAEHQSFTSERGTLLDLLGRGDPAAGRQLAATDPPAHQALRAPLQRELTPRQVGRHAAALRAGVQRLLAPGADGAPFDLATALAGLPLLVAGPLLDLPPNDLPELTRLVAMCTAEDDLTTQLPQGPAATAERGHRALFAYLSDLVRRRIRAPGDDLASVLLAAAMAPGTVVANCYSLLLGAAGTLPQLPALALAGLARTGGFPGWARHPELLDAGVEECLRWASPAKYFMRHATHSVRLGAVSISAGQPVVAWIGAANRDPAVFPEPDVLDVRRRPNRHLAFGAGPHYCLGAHLARLALRTLFRELFTLFEDVELAGTPVPVRSLFLAGFRQLPVRGHPRRAR